MTLQSDPTGLTRLYIMYVEGITLLPDRTELANVDIWTRWYVDSVSHNSHAVTLKPGETIRARYVSFMVVTLSSQEVMEKPLTMTFTVPDGDDHLCVAWLKLSDLSMEEQFKEHHVELRTQEGVVAVVSMHSACQHRWAYEPITPMEGAYFLEPSLDAQSEHLYKHILGDDVAELSQADDGAAGQDAADAAAEAQRQQQEAEEQQRREKQRLEEEEEARRKQEAARAAAEKKAQEDRERELEREREREREREKERAEKDEQERRRREEDERRDRQRREEQERSEKLKREEADRKAAEERRRREEDDKEERERQRRREEEDQRESERQRLREEEEDKRRRAQRERERERERELELERERRLQREREEADRLRRQREEEERRDLQRARERRQWEEDRERLRRDAKMERQREVQEKERRAQDRRQPAGRAEARSEVSDRSGAAAGMAQVGRGSSDRAGSAAAANERLRQESERGERAGGSRLGGSGPSGTLSAIAGDHDVDRVAVCSPLGGGSIGGAASSVGGLDVPPPVLPASGSTSHRRDSVPKPGHSARKAAAPAPAPAPAPGPSRAPGRRHAHDGTDSEGSDQWVFDGHAIEDMSMYRQGGSSIGPCGGAPSGASTRVTSAQGARRKSSGTQPAPVPMAMRLEQLRTMSSMQQPGLWAPGSLEEEQVYAQAPMNLLGEPAVSVAQPWQTPRTQHLGPAGHEQYIYDRHVRGTPRSQEPPGGNRRTPRRMGAHCQTNEASVQTQTEICPSPAAAGVLAAALTDAAAGSFPGVGIAPVAVEECILRLLVLQRELGQSTDPGRAVLADAAAGLAPRMLQVLDAARKVCETNRTKFQEFCQESGNAEFDKMVSGADYLKPQINALDKLCDQYSSLLPSSGTTRHSTPPGPMRTHNYPQALAGPAAYGHQGLTDRINGMAQAHQNTFPGGYPHDFNSTASMSGRLTPGLTPAMQHHAAPMHHGNFPPQQREALATPATPRQIAAVAATAPSGVPVNSQRILDPAGNGPALPILRAGGSTPPPSPKCRQHVAASAPPSAHAEAPRHDAAPARMELRPDARAALSSWGAPAPQQQPVSARHQGHQRPTQQNELAGFAFGTPSGPPQLSARGGRERHTPPSGRQHAPVNGLVAALSPGTPSSSGGGQAYSGETSAVSTPRARGNHTHRSSLSSGQAPLRAALQQLRGVTDSLSVSRRGAQRATSARGRDAGGGAHAGAGSPSPQPVEDREAVPSRRQPPQEDKYLKILQSLQAKGATTGLTAQLQDSRGPAPNGPSAARARKVIADSDSDETYSDRSDRRSRRLRLANKASSAW